MRRSKRIETLDQRPVNLDGYINEWPEMCRRHRILQRLRES